ncbi:hypothetical protein [Sinomicrobium sp. M5D2P9]
MDVLKKSAYFILLFCSLSACTDDDKQEETDLGETPDVQAEIPVLKTLEISNVTLSTATVKGSVTNNGGASVTRRGICWDRTGTPTVDVASAEAVSVRASGEFSANLNNLEENKEYYVRAFAVNNAGTGYGETLSFVTGKNQEPVQPIVFLDSTSFESPEKFTEHWNMFYPWGTDHNGSARMYEDQVTLEPDGVLRMEANRVYEDEGNSTADPWLKIRYHSGAIHFKEHIVVNDSLPSWEISGDFQVPTMVGSWPAFWITGAWSWPPEIDIMEFKGNNTNWQNTVTGPDWQNTSWQTTKTTVSDAGGWHNYKLIMNKISATDVDIELFIDNDHKATHTADFVGKPFWLIINMQMEGASGSPGPEHAGYRARNIYVAATPATMP